MLGRVVSYESRMGENVGNSHFAIITTITSDKNVGETHAARIDGGENVRSDHTIRITDFQSIA